MGIKNRGPTVAYTLPASSHMKWVTLFRQYTADSIGKQAEKQFEPDKKPPKIPAVFR